MTTQSLWAAFCRGAAVCGLALGVATGVMMAPAPLHARDLTAAENQSLEQTVQSFNDAMRRSDFARVANTIPPRVLDAIAKSAQVDVAALRATLVQQMSELLASVKIESFAMDLPGAERKELADGSPYLLIPTTTVIDAGGEKTKVSSQTLALLDGGAWYLVRVSDAQQVAILRQVYPPFASVTFPEARMEALP